MRVLESLTRVFVAPEQLRPTVAAYLALTGGRCSLYFPFPERGLWLAAVSSPTASFLVIAGSEDAIVPLRATQLTLVVDDIHAVASHCAPLGATVLQEVTAVPTGYQTRWRHPDGLVVEYVEHTAAADAFRASDL